MKAALLRAPALALLLSAQAPAPEKPAPFVNQAGYNLGEAKRFTLPGAPDGTQFQILRVPGGAVVFQGVTRGQAGDFTAFDAAASSGDDYVVEVPGWGRSVPFKVADHLMERISSRLAYQFFIDVRGGHRTDLSPRAVTGGGPSRDGGGQTLETTFDGLLYASNPALFDRWANELRYYNESMYSVVLPGAEPPKPAEDYRDAADVARHRAPDLIKLLLWHAEWAYKNKDYEGPTSLGFENWADGYRGVRQFGYTDDKLQEFDRQNLLDQLAAAHAFYRPFLRPYMSAERHAEMRAAALKQWEAYDRYKEVRYWVKSEKWIDKGRLEFNEQGSAFGQGLLRNLLMYLGEKGEPDGQVERFARYVRACAEDVVKNWDFDNPVHTWAARNAEHITPQALAMLQIMAPELAPAGTKAKLQAWRDYVMRRSDNLWHYRTHSDTEWAHRRSKEVGTVAGMGGAMFAVAHAIGDPALRARGWSQVNFVFGANPAGAHLSNKSAVRVALNGYWPGVERGWPHAFVWGTGWLGDVRGTLDGSPTNDAFPYDPDRAALADQNGIYGTEGWAVTNRAWLSTVAFSTLGSHRVRFVDAAGRPVTRARAGEPVCVELKAALNLDPATAETGHVDLSRGDAASERVVVTETGPDTGLFVAELPAPARGRLTASYGHLAFAKRATLDVR